MNIRRELKIVLDGVTREEYYIYDGEELQIEVTRIIKEVKDKDSLRYSN